MNERIAETLKRLGAKNAISSREGQGDVQGERIGSDGEFQAEGHVRELGADSAEGREEADSRGGVREEAGEPEDYGYVERAAVADLIREEAEAIAKEAKHGDLLKTIDRAAKAIATSLNDDGDAKVAASIDAQTKAMAECFGAIAKCLDRNTAALEKLAKAEQRQVHVEVREEKGAASLASAVRLLVESNKDVIAAIHDLVKPEPVKAAPPASPKPAGYKFDIDRGNNGEMLSVTAIPLRAHPITGKVG